MTTYTNNTNLPEAVVRTLTADQYVLVGDASVTGIIRPGQMAGLERLHRHEMPPEEVADLLYRVLGSVAHEVLYRGRNPEAVMAEERLLTTIAGWTISGKPDVYDIETKTILDFKLTSAWGVVFEPNGKPEHIHQLNLYAALLRRNGYEVKGLQVVNLLRDWSRKEMLKRGDYPKSAIVVQDLPLWAEKEAQEFLEERVAVHQLAATGYWDPCTDEERWKSKTTGVFNRCKTYCRVSTFCEQFAADKGEKKQ